MDLLKSARIQSRDKLRTLKDETRLRIVQYRRISINARNDYFSIQRTLECLEGRREVSQGHSTLCPTSLIFCARRCDLRSPVRRIQRSDDDHGEDRDRDGRAK